MNNWVINYINWKGKRRSFKIPAASREVAEQHARSVVGRDNTNERVISIKRNFSYDKEGMGNPKSYKS